MATKKPSKTGSKPSGKSSGTIYRQGDSGSTIKNTQQALADRGLLSQNNVTGTYDSATAKAIKTFKTNTGGSNTYGNTFGNETLKKLLNSGSSGSSQKTTQTVIQYVPYQDPASVNFDSGAWKQAYIDQMVSELTSNYNTDKANLDKTYNTSITNYGNQLNDTNMSYDANIQALQRQKYEDTQQAKNEAFSRGLGFGGLGQAIEQTARNNANNKIADTQNERTRAINNINTLINQAKYNYGIDSDTLLKNFNADKLKYMSTAEIQALEKKLQVDMYNTDWTNKFLQDSNNRQFASSESDKKLDWQAGQNALDREFQSGEAQKDRDAQTALAKLQAKLYGSGRSGGGSYGGYGSRYSSGSSGSAKDVLAANYLQSAGISTDNADAKKLYWDFIDGSISWSEFRNGVDRLVSGGSSSGSETGSNSSKSSLNLTPIGKLLGDAGFGPSNIRTGFSGVSGKTGTSGATDGHTKKKGGHR